MDDYKASSGEEEKTANFHILIFVEKCSENERISFEYLEKVRGPSHFRWKLIEAYATQNALPIDIYDVERSIKTSIYLEILQVLSRYRIL